MANPRPKRGKKPPSTGDGWSNGGRQVVTDARAAVVVRHADGRVGMIVKNDVQPLPGGPVEPMTPAWAIQWAESLCGVCGVAILPAGRECCGGCVRR